MKNTCPACGHEWEAKLRFQQKGAKARLRGLTKKERSAAMRALVERRWAAKRSKEAQ